MTGLDPALLHECVAAYDAKEPFARVEDERLETMPDAFAEGSYLWKDVEWIVRWYCRRPLESGSRPAEEAFRTNGMDEIRSAIDAAKEADDPAGAIEALLALEGVNVPIASAFLQFMSPERYAVIDERSWSALVDAGELTAPYPDTLVPADYERYLMACRRVGETAELRPVDVARALWRLGADDAASS